MSENPIAEVAEMTNGVTVSTPLGITAIALQMAIKYHGDTCIKDGVLYQQYKMEGRNIRELNMDTVFETAMQIEQHLIMGERRIQDIMNNAMIRVIDSILEDETPSTNPADRGEG